MQNDTPVPLPVLLKDYTPPSYLVNSIHLDVDIRPQATLVTATLDCVRNPAVSGDLPLLLDGEDLETLSLSLDGCLLPAQAYSLSEHQLVLKDLPERFTLETRVRIQPDKNTQLSGLYRSRDGYFHPVRAARFSSHHLVHRPAGCDGALHGDRACRQVAAFPFLLSNGNPA